MSGNREQIEYWNGKAGETWVQAQERTDRSLSALTEQALKIASAGSAERVLDIGCGCGTTTIELGKVGADVTGVDISRPMLALARERAAGLGNVRFQEADASTAAFDADHDLVFSRFGVMFFSDPVSAFANIRTALAPDGRMTFMCWQSPANNPWMSTGGRIVQPFIAAANPDAPAPDPRAPGPFAFADDNYIRDILNAAGFSGVVMDEARSTMNLGATVDDALENQSQIGPLARALSELEGAARDQAIAAVRAEFERLIGPDGLTLEAAAWVVTARP